MTSWDAVPKKQFGIMMHSAGIFVLEANGRAALNGAPLKFLSPCGAKSAKFLVNCKSIHRKAVRTGRCTNSRRSESCGHGCLCAYRESNSASIASTVCSGRPSIGASALNVMP